MGLSSKQVSSDGLDWSQTLLQAQTLELPKPPAARRQQQQNQPQAELLKCPRCDSTNTKFCYYNNYNKSQPRHFCKACKRHWTKGGTLRNVPVGGGRKNKRHKASSKTSSAKASTSSRSTGTNNGKIRDKGGLQVAVAGQADHKQQKKQSLPLVLGDHKGISNILKQSTLISPPSSTFQQTAISYSNFGVQTSNGVFPQNQDLPFSYSCSSSSFEACSSSIPTSFQSLNVYNFPGEAVEDSAITTTVPSSNCSITMAQPWQVPSTSNAMDMASYWNWDDIETLVSGDFNIPWDDPEIKP